MNLANGTSHAGLVADALRSRPRGSAVVDSRVVASWRRCVNTYSLDPERRPEPVVVDRPDLKERQERTSKLVDIAHAEMANLYQQVAGSGHAILLTDQDGVVLDYAGDPIFTDTASRASLQIGAVWAERSQGTNGMGLCLIEKRPLIIHRNEHFFTENTNLTCSTAPIFGPTGELVAVLDASCDARRAQQHTVVLVNMSAQLIENRLFLSCLRAHYILRFHSRPEFISTLGEGVIAFDGDGRVRGANRIALFQLDLTDPNKVIGTPLEELFAIRVEDALENAHRRAGANLPVHDTAQGRRFYASFQAPGAISEGSGAARWRGAGPDRSLPRLGEKPSLDGLELGDVRMRRNIERARKLVERDIPFILLGETGTGKDALAHAVHQSSPRAGKPFVAVNCASLPETLIESELFGYKPGAFTGAARDGSRGKIVQAHGGTLFLDEIGDMPLHLQARLLRVLEEREVMPLGGEVLIKVDIRLISATHKDLMGKVEDGSFREDLYYRLNGMSLHIPPLRDREDRRRLIARLLEIEAGGAGRVRIDDAAMAALDRYPWPGNIRQLRNTLRTLIGLREEDRIYLEDLPDEILFSGDESMVPGSSPVAPDNPLDIAERGVILRELQAAHWNVTRVAAKLTISRNTLYRKMKRFDIRPPR